jgi:glycosyltransferase involved in cell wall biosynthesis
MRILMVTEDIPAPQVGGLGKHVVTLSNALIAAGHEVVLMGRSDVDYAQHAAEVGFSGRFIAGFRMDRNGWKESQLGVWMPGKRRALAARIERAIEVHASGFDVVHYHGHLPLVGRTLAADLPLVQTRHDQGSECLLHTRFKRGDVCADREARACAHCATARPNAVQGALSGFAVAQFRGDVARNFEHRPTIFVSDFLRRQFALAVPGAQLDGSHVLHNFIDLERLRLAARRATGVQSGRVVMAGRIDEAKGFGAFLRAWCAAPNPQPARLTLIGDGPERQSLAREFAPVAEFLGWQAYDEAVRLTASAHVCVMPSVWEEPCGTTLLEALQLGRPCVALRRGGTPELQRYERYPGQLMLGDSMDELVTLTRQALARPAVDASVADHSEADVHAALPRLTALYEQTLARREGTAAP